MIKNSTYTGTITLTSDIGSAAGFIEATIDNSKLTIEPSIVHVGEYKIKMTLTDGI